MAQDPPTPPPVLSINIEEEMKSSFMDYAMSVIVSRALPDVRDGLKPVHRRILYTMHVLKNFYNQPYRKSARVVGDTMGRFHPHGDTALYDTLVRMAQPFSMRYMLADGQGNFGSVDGDPPAAMRYTEVRMQRYASELLADIDKDTVVFVPSYNEEEEEPLVLPTRAPNLLVNGASGIAVGMATNIPPHNLGEVIDGVIEVIHNPEVSLRELVRLIPGPDFPTGGMIYGRSGIERAYQTGRGSVIMRGRAAFEESKQGRRLIVITEIPYQLNKTRLLEKIADLVKEKSLAGVSDLRDESDREGMRIVITLKKDAVDEVVLNQLYKQTPLQSTFGVNMIAIVNGEPRMLDLRTAIDHFIEHRKEVVTRRTEYELRQARARIEIVEGLGIAIQDIDRVVTTIRASDTAETARQALQALDFVGYGEFMRRAGLAEEEIAAQTGDDGIYRLSERQAQAILEMRLQRLTGLQQERLIAEYRELRETIARLEALLADEDLLMAKIVEELQEIREQYADERRTEIVETAGELTMEDLVTNDEMVLTMTHSGYVKRTPLKEYRAQARGGRGRRGAALKDTDVVTEIFVARNHQNVFMFTDAGRVFRRKTYEIPQGAPAARGKAFVNLLELQPGEKVIRMLPVPEVEEGEEHYVVMGTRNGIVKKTALTAYGNIKSVGIRAGVIDEGDHLIEARITDGNRDILLGTADGLAIRFPETELRVLGRVSRGVKGISLREGDHVVGMAILEPNSQQTVLTVCERGYGKRTELGEYPSQKRGGKGVITIKTSRRNGKAIDIRTVDEEDDLLLVTNGGQLIRISAGDISVVGRNTQGVTLVRLGEDELVVSAARVAERDDEEDEDGDDDGDAVSDGDTDRDSNADGDGDSDGDAGP